MRIGWPGSYEKQTLRNSIDFWCRSSRSEAGELKIFGSRVTRMVVGDIGPAYTKATGNKLAVITDVAAVMKRHIDGGEPFDIAVLVNFQADDLIKKGKLLADSRADVMRAGIGV